MNRRQLILGSAAIASALSPWAVVAQTATPEVDEQTYLYDYLDLQGVERASARWATLEAGGPATAFRGDLYYVGALAFRFSTVPQATLLHGRFQRAYEEWYDTEVPEWTLGRFSRASVRSIGEETWGWIATTTNDTDEQYQFGILVVRQETTTQILFGATSAGETLSRLADIAERLVDRWPSTARDGYDDGLRVGDTFDALPRYEDLPEGMMIEDDDDITHYFDSPPKSQELSFRYELTLGGQYVDSNDGECSGAGFFAVVDSGNLLVIEDLETDEELWTGIIPSPSTSTTRSCVWEMQVTGLPFADRYRFVVGARTLALYDYTYLAERQTGAGVRETITK